MTYKVTNFVNYKLNENNEIDLSHENRDELKGMISEKHLLYHSPELSKYYKENVEQYEEETIRKRK